MTTRLTRIAAAGALAAALSFGSVTAADASEQSVEDITLSWGLSQEAGGGAYFGGCNFLGIGVAGNTGSSRVWTEGDGFYKSTDGNVTIVKDGASGDEAPTWGTKCLGANGSAVGTGAGSSTNNRAVFSGGTGTVDLEAGTATVSWTGSFTSAFYGGMTYWSATDPELVIDADGTGTLTATLSGYGTSMDDMSKWEAISGRTVTMATLSDVELTADGLTVTPDYLGVTMSDMSQTTTGTSWGSFPQSFVDFQQLTGQTSYWYSSDGGADPKKPATALTVGWDVEEETTPPTTEPTEQDKGDVDVEVVVPDTTEPEPEPALTLSVSGTANLGTASVLPQGFSASGELPQVTVSDTREGGQWSVNGYVSDFTSSTGGTIAARSLGWQPKVMSGDAQVGARVQAHAPGLAAPATLASGSEGEATLGSTLTLHALASTTAGAYNAQLTLTALG